MNPLADVKISHESIFSLHVQLHNQFRHFILSGRWPAGTRLPSELQLQDHLNISRSTIRLALQSAEVEGLIERIPGKGTFVKEATRMNSGKKFIAFVTSGFESDFNRLLLNGAESVVRCSHHRIVFCSPPNSDEERKLLGQLQRDNVSGILLWPHSDLTYPDHLDHRSGYQTLPIVMMDRTFEGLEYDCVTSDNYGGGRMIMQHLLELGHRRIAFCSHNRFVLPVLERLRAYNDMLQEAGIEVMEPWLLAAGSGEVSAGQALRAAANPNSPEIRQILNCLKQEPQPTAVFAVNDHVAIIVARAAKYLGLRIPEDLSIGGFDDTDIALYLETALTTVAQDSFLIGKRSAELLIERLEGYNGPPRTEILPVELRVRSSTASPLLERM
jgi:GntR family transcriptional regulator, arabinose operon transcriptional repressor